MSVDENVDILSFSLSERSILHFIEKLDEDGMFVDNDHLRLENILLERINSRIETNIKKQIHLRFEKCKTITF